MVKSHQLYIFSSYLIKQDNCSLENHLESSARVLWEVELSPLVSFRSKQQLYQKYSCSVTVNHPSLLCDLITFLSYGL
jgi:hypothetical protein